MTRKILHGQVQQAKVAGTKVPLKNVIAATRACLHKDQARTIGQLAEEAKSESKLILEGFKSYKEAIEIMKD